MESALPQTTRLLNTWKDGFAIKASQHSGHCYWINAAAWLVFRLSRYDHVSDALAILHWLRLPERVNFKLALTAYRVLALPYLNQLVPVSSLSGRRRLRSSFTL